MMDQVTSDAEILKYLPVIGALLILVYAAAYFVCVQFVPSKQAIVSQVVSRESTKTCWTAHRTGLANGTFSAIRVTGVAP